MRILIANDDGYLAPGLSALVAAVQGLGEIEVIAPEQNASGTSNALTLNRPLQVFAAGAAHPGVRFVNGTPSDCVHVALTGLLGYKPDLVLSGINQGANMGDDTLYSGTVAAAMEGFLFGIPSIAFSQVEKGWSHLDAAGRVVRALVQQLLDETWCPGSDPTAPCGSRVHAARSAAAAPGCSRRVRPAAGSAWRACHRRHPGFAPRFSGPAGARRTRPAPGTSGRWHRRRARAATG